MSLPEGLRATRAGKKPAKLPEVLLERNMLSYDLLGIGKEILSELRSKKRDPVVLNEAKHFVQTISYLINTDSTVSSGQKTKLSRLASKIRRIIMKQQGLSIPNLTSVHKQAKKAISGTLKNSGSLSLDEIVLIVKNACKKLKRNDQMQNAESLEQMLFEKYPEAKTPWCLLDYNWEVLDLMY